MQARLHFLTRHSSLNRNTLSRSLTEAGIETQCPDKDAAERPELIFFDTVDTELLEQAHTLSGDGTGRVLAISVAQTPQTDKLWQLIQAGAAEIINWDASPDPTAAIVARLERWAIVDKMVASDSVADLLVGQHPIWKKTVRRLIELAHFSDSSILLLGESGTGKELAARLVHSLDARPKKAEFVVLDCATIVPELSGSEFFGHERGAFTNALQAREGAIELADNGTLFVDEVGELPVALQSQLLRAVQERSYKRVGGNIWRSADFRLVCATNRELSADVTKGRFRQDLYFRIATSVVRLPPLRDRRQDIPALAQHFMRVLHPNEAPPPLDPMVRDYLLSRDYPGNVRELRQVVARIMTRHVGPGPVTIGDIPEDDWPAPSVAGSWRDDHFEQAIRRALSSGVKLKDIGRAAEDEAIQIAVTDEQGNLQRAARRLGVTDRALQLRRANPRSHP